MAGNGRVVLAQTGSFDISFEMAPLDPAAASAEPPRRIEAKMSATANGYRISSTGTQDGQVVCINTGDAKLTGWPMWGGSAGHGNAATAD